MSAKSFAMIRKCVGVGCTVYCAYQLGSYVYDQYTGAEGRGVEERPRPAVSQSDVSTQTDDCLGQATIVKGDATHVNQSKTITNNRSNVSTKTTGNSESKNTLHAKRPFLSQIRSFKKKETRTKSSKLEPGHEKMANGNDGKYLPWKKENIHASRKKDFKISDPQRGGRESETRRSLLSEIQKFPKKKASLSKVSRNRSNKSNVESDGSRAKRAGLMPSRLLSDIRQRGNTLSSSKDTKILKKTNSCPPVHNHNDVQGKSSPGAAKRKSKERLALFDSIKKSGTGSLSSRTKKRTPMPSVLLDDINKLRKTKSSGATFWPRRTSLVAEIRKNKSNPKQSFPSGRAVDSQPKRKMSLFEEMKLKKNRLRPVTANRPRSQQQKEDNDPNGSVPSQNGSVTGRKKRGKKKAKSKNRGDSSGRSDGKSELQKLLARRQQGKSLKMTPEKIR